MLERLPKSVIACIIDGGMQMCDNDCQCYWGLVDVVALRRTCRALYVAIGDERQYMPYWERIAGVLRRKEVPDARIENLRQILTTRNAVLSGSFVMQHVVYAELWQTSQDYHDLDVFIETPNTVNSTTGVPDTIESKLTSLGIESSVYMEYGPMEITETRHIYAPFGRVFDLDVIFVVPDDDSKEEQHSSPLDFQRYIDQSFDLDICKVTVSFSSSNGKRPIPKFWAANKRSLLDRVAIFRNLPILYRTGKTSNRDMIWRIEKYQRRGFTIRLASESRFSPPENGNVIPLMEPIDFARSYFHYLVDKHKITYMNKFAKLSVLAFDVMLWGMKCGYTLGDRNEIPDISHLFDCIHMLSI